MNAFAKALVQPLLWELRKAIAEMRAASATDDEIQALVALAAREVERHIENEEHREWLLRQFEKTARPPVIAREGTATVN